MAKKQYLTIKEIAELAGVTVQAIYPRLENDFKQYFKVINGKKHLEIGVLEEFDKRTFKEIVQDDLKNLNETLKVKNEMLEQMLDEKNRQLELLQEDIREERRRNQELTDKMVIFADQSQQLQLAQMKRDGLLEANIGADEVAPETVKKRKWWQFGEKKE